MINQISVRLWDARSAMLSPSSLMDRLLDQIEKLGCTLMPAEPDGLACERIRLDPRID